MSDSEVGELRAEVRNLKEQMVEVRRDLKEVLDLLEQGKGARRAMALLAGVASSVAAMIGWALGVLRGS